jgi:hypothetical protein
MFHGLHDSADGEGVVATFSVHIKGWTGYPGVLWASEKEQESLQHSKSRQISNRHAFGGRLLHHPAHSVSSDLRNA